MKNIVKKAGVIILNATTWIRS